MLDNYEHIFRSPWFWLPAIFILPTAAIFWVTDLDILVSGQFFDSAALKNPWEGSHSPGVRFLYHSIPAMTTAVIISTLLIILVANATRKWRLQRLKATYVLLVFLIGPGLIVNAILKDNWGRPRPRDTVDFGAELQYLPPWKADFGGEGRAFPSGHASAAFALLAFYLLSRRKRREDGRENLVLASVLSYASLVGYARIAEGGHYLSDIIWAGWITAGTAFFLYKIYFEAAINDAEQT